MVNKVGVLKTSDFKSLGEYWNKLELSDEITVYEDQYMEENTLYRGRKENGPTFLIVSTKISKLISNIILRKERKEKLNKINEY